MTVTNLFSKASLGGLALALGGCAAMGDRVTNLPRQAVTVDSSVTAAPVTLNACEREGIKARPARYMFHQEMAQRTRAGEVNYFYNGYYLFAKKSLTEQWAPLVGALVVGGLTHGIGNAGVRVAATAAGAGAGAWGGEKLSDQAILERMAKEKGCEQAIDALGPAPQPDLIDMHRRADRPINAPSRAQEQRRDFIQP